MVPVSVIVAAAGQGTRMGSKIKKQYLDLEGKPILIHTLQVLDKLDAVGNIIVVVSPGDEEYCRENIIQFFKLHKVLVPVRGGQNRQESVFNGLLALPEKKGIVLIHDGVRPFVSGEQVTALIEAVTLYGAATLAVPAKDTIKLVSDGKKVIKTLPRDELWLAQTPQAFEYKLIMDAHVQALSKGFSATDDASLVEFIGHPVKIVEGSYQNIKITTPEDLIIARAILNRRHG